MFVMVNIAIAWWVGGKMMLDSEKVDEAIPSDFNAIYSLKEDQSRGKRNTYCDHLRHLVKDHEYSVTILNECQQPNLTDLQITL
jgi:hypothetical protein